MDCVKGEKTISVAWNVCNVVEKSTRVSSECHLKSLLLLASHQQGQLLGLGDTLQDQQQEKLGEESLRICPWQKTIESSQRMPRSLPTETISSYESPAGSLFSGSGIKLELRCRFYQANALFAGKSQAGVRYFFPRDTLQCLCKKTHVEPYCKPFIQQPCIQQVCYFAVGKELTGKTQMTCFFLVRHSECDPECEINDLTGFVYA